MTKVSFCLDSLRFQKIISILIQDLNIHLKVSDFDLNVENMILQDCLFYLEPKSLVWTFRCKFDTELSEVSDLIDKTDGIQLELPLILLVKFGWDIFLCICTFIYDLIFCLYHSFGHICKFILYELYY